VRRPVIGLCTAAERARWTYWDEEAVLLPRSYVDHVQRAGGLAVLLPPDQGDPEDSIRLLDGLVLCGGADIGDAPERDAYELRLAAAALEHDLPFLGICRGMQVMNVARGGTLTQHLPDDLGHEDHRRVLGTFENADHDVRLADGSLAARVARTTRHATKSHHHQGVDRIGDGLAVTGWATIDDLPEALEVPGGRFALGVQWHPEADETSPLIAGLVEEARAYAAERAGGRKEAA
jgi:putative glutamine amidotransferase